MKAHIHYDPYKTFSYAVGKAVVRLVFALSAASNLKIRYFDICSALTYEKRPEGTRIYIRQLPGFDGSLKHKKAYRPA